MKTNFALLAAMALVVSAGMWWAVAGTATGDAARLPYAGYLENNGVGESGTFGLTFELCVDAADAACAAWREAHAQVAVSAGRFAVELGETTPLSPSVLRANPYLRISVTTDKNNVALAVPAVLEGRQMLGSTAFAYRGAPGRDFQVDGAVTIGGNLQLGPFYFDGNDDTWLRLRDGDGGAFKDFAAGKLHAATTLTSVGDATMQRNLQIGPFYLDGNDDTWLRLRAGDNGAYKDLATGQLYATNTLYADASIQFGTASGARPKACLLFADKCPTGWVSNGHYTGIKQTTTDGACPGGDAWNTSWATWQWCRMLLCCNR